MRGSILVVEDDRYIREALVGPLEEEGYSVAQAGDGAQALEVLRTEGSMPDLILLDLMMPVMNGYEFRAEQLARPNLACIPVVAVSADPHARSKAASLNVAAILPKPVALAKLLDAVQAIVKPS